MTASVNQSVVQTTTLAEPFDCIAPDYDRLFTNSCIGQAQRSQVWREIERCFPPGSHVLDLNCGTGADALALARRGVRVSAYDASAEMIEAANRKLMSEPPSSQVQFSVLRNENLFMLEGPFDGVLSNFGGLNCSLDWAHIAGDLARIVKPGGHVLLCVFGCLCLWEMIYYLLHGRFRKAFRRVCRRPSVSCFDGIFFNVIYPSSTEARRLFSPGFLLCGWRGVGVFVPPSYLEPHLQARKRVLELLASLDSMSAHLPGVRSCGDHMLLDFVRRPA